MNSKLAVLAVVILSLSSEALGFKCYVCNSRNDTGCDQSPLDKRFLKDCDTIDYLYNKEKNPYTVCRHQTVEIGGKMMHDRRCGWKMNVKKREICATSTNNVVKTMACECHSEGCNSSSSLTVGALTFVASILSIWFVRK